MGGSDSEEALDLVQGPPDDDTLTGWADEAASLAEPDGWAT
jgi:hypothetical protein